MPDEPQPDPNPLDLTAATPEEIAEVLSYALRYDERGKPRRSGPGEPDRSAFPVTAEGRWSDSQEASAKGSRTRSTREGGKDGYRAGRRPHFTLRGGAKQSSPSRRRDPEATPFG